MNSEIAQVVALVACGNYFLLTGKLDNAYVGGKLFSACRAVTFAVPQPAQGQWSETLYARNPRLWLKRLRAEDVRELCVHYGRRPRSLMDSRIGTAFVGGGGSWTIEAGRAADSDYWQGHWRTGRAQKGGRIWEVTYYRMSTHAQPLASKTADLNRVAARLDRTLARIQDFADTHEAQFWGNYFGKARAALQAADPRASSEQLAHLAPPGALSREAWALLAAADWAWVFGGQGSWNDLVFTGDAERVYDSLSDRLFKLLNQAIVQAVNSSLER